MSDLDSALLVGGTIALVLIGALLGRSSGTPAQRQPTRAPPRAARQTVPRAAVSKRYWYRSRHIGKPFKFNMVKQPDGEVRIFIVNQPGYRSRATDLHSTHRYFDRQKGYYICIDDSLRPTNFNDAKSWAAYWANKTAKYINTGRKFS